MKLKFAQNFFKSFKPRKLDADRKKNKTKPKNLGKFQGRDISLLYSDSNNKFFAKIKIMLQRFFSPKKFKYNLHEIYVEIIETANTQDINICNEALKVFFKSAEKYSTHSGRKYYEKYGDLKIRANNLDELYEIWNEIEESENKKKVVELIKTVPYDLRIISNVSYILNNPQETAEDINLVLPHFPKN